MVKRFFLSSLRAMLLFCILVSPAHPAAAPSPVAQAAPSTPAVPAPVLSAQAVPAPVLSAPTVPAPTPVSAAPLSVVVKSTANRGETNVGAYWIGEDFAAGFQTLGATTDMDYRGEYHRPHSPEPALNLYMRGYPAVPVRLQRAVRVLPDGLYCPLCPGIRYRRQFLLRFCP